MNSIGFTNFRKFVSFPEIPFGDITIMVGGNNAGKSTLVKAMLLMRDFLKSRVESAANNSIFKTFIPQFGFDAEHVNVGDFYRAFCRQSPSSEDTISFEMKIDKYHFIVKVRGERKPGIVPQVSMIVISDESRDITFTFDFEKSQMTAQFGYDNKALNEIVDKPKVIGRFRVLDDLKEQLASSKDLAKITDLKSQIEQLEKEIELQKQALGFSITEEDSVTIDLSFFMGDNVGKLVIPELIRGFVHYAWTGTLGNKRSQKYKEQEGKKSFLKGKAEIINKISEELDLILSSQVVEYIYSHSVAQTPCYSNASSTNDYATHAIHDFYRSRISSGDEDYAIIDYGLKLFGIGDSLKVISFLGDSYRVVVFDDDNPEIIDEKEQGYPGGMDLADKGMGSIQIILLLLRLATLARKYKGLNLTVLLEEPEQNLHPALQSKLADLLNYVNKNFGICFIVETHSEYLIRKSQVLVSEEHFADEAELENKNKFKVYYLPCDGTIPYEMQYRTDGNFSNEFGPGFFDTATNLLYEIL